MLREPSIPYKAIGVSELAARPPNLPGAGGKCCPEPVAILENDPLR